MEKTLDDINAELTKEREYAIADLKRRLAMAQNPQERERIKKIAAADQFYGNIQPREFEEIFASAAPAPLTPVTKVKDAAPAQLKKIETDSGKIINRSALVLEVMRQKNLSMPQAQALIQNQLNKIREAKAAEVQQKAPAPLMREAMAAVVMEV